jgi:hypothetical protein
MKLLKAEDIRKQLKVFKLSILKLTDSRCNGGLKMNVNYIKEQKLPMGRKKKLG